MNTTEGAAQFIELATDIVSAYVSNNSVAAGELQHFQFQPRRGRQHRVEVVVGQAVGNHSDFDGGSFQALQSAP